MAPVNMNDPIAHIQSPYPGFFAQLALSIIVLMARPTLKLLPFIMSLAVAAFTLPLYQESQVTRDLGIGLDITGRTLEDVMIKTSIFMAMHLWALVFVEGYLLPYRQTFLGRLRAAYKMIFNGRRIGTTKLAPQMPLPDGHLQFMQAAEPKQPDEQPAEFQDEQDTKNEENESEEDHKQAQDTGKPTALVENSSSQQSDQIGKGFHDRLGFARRENRLPFIARRAGLIFLLYVLEYIVKPSILYSYLPNLPSETVAAFDGFFTRLNEITVAEMVYRSYLAFETTWAGYVFYTMLHSFASIFFVAIRLDEPHEWPPLFGDVRQAYSMRRYWVKFYDRLIYRTCSENAKCIFRLLRIGGHGGARDAPWQRWLLNLCIFTISAFMHAQASWWDGIRCGYWDEVQWWMSNFVGIVMETAFQAVLRRVAPRFYDWTMGNCVCKIAGFAWVYFFTIYTASIFTAKVTQCNIASYNAHFQ